MAAAVECIWYWVEIAILDTEEWIEVKQQSILASWNTLFIKSMSLFLLLLLSLLLK